MVIFNRYVKLPEGMQTSWNLTEVLQPFKNPHMGRWKHIPTSMTCWCQGVPRRARLEPVGPPWIYFQQRADQILRVRAGRRLGIAAEESEVALLDGLVAWGFGREKWGWKYGKYGNGVSGGIRGCMSTILVHNVCGWRILQRIQASTCFSINVQSGTRPHVWQWQPGARSNATSLILFRTNCIVGYVSQTGMYHLPSTDPKQIVPPSYMTGR